jgi:hypothetical protein
MSTLDPEVTAPYKTNRISGKMLALIRAASIAKYS